MIIVHKNPGQKINYTVEGTVIVFDEELTIDLSAYQEDWDIHLLICYDSAKKLIVGPGRTYVAELDIPAITYHEEGEDEEAQSVPDPLDMDKVTLTLWAVEKKEKAEEAEEE